MFTIKHIRISGEETLHESKQVRFTPAQTSTSTDRVWFDLPDGSTYPLDGGTVFVMNEFGKTVSRYDLGASPVPIVGNGLSDPRSGGVGEAQSAIAA